MLVGRSSGHPSFVSANIYRPESYTQTRGLDEVELWSLVGLAEEEPEPRQSDL